MGESHLSTDVFTPTTPARLTFIERESINDQLVDSLKTPGKQIVVYGSSGSGKTTLLTNKLTQVYERHITTRCMDGMRLDAILLDAFDQLALFYLSDSEATQVRASSKGIGAEYAGIKASIGASTSNTSRSASKRIVPPQLTPQRLAKFLGAAGYCWVLEDFHKVAEENKKQLSQVMKVFMDCADEYRELRIIAIGAVDTARQVVQYDPEMRNRVSEICVPLMTDDEIRAILDRGQELLNVRISTSLREDITKYSSGLASVCHQLGLNICQAADIVRTRPSMTDISEEATQNAIKRYVADSTDTLKKSFGSALRQERKGRFENGRVIVSALAHLPVDGATHNEIYTEIRKSEPTYPSGNLTLYLRELTSPKRGNLLRRDVGALKFMFSDPLSLAYARCLFVKPTGKRHETPMTLDPSDLSKMITENLKAIFAIYTKSKGAKGDSP